MSQSRRQLKFVCQHFSRPGSPLLAAVFDRRTQRLKTSPCLMTANRFVQLAQNPTGPSPGLAPFQAVYSVATAMLIES